MTTDLQIPVPFETRLRSLVRWGLYPASWAVLLVGIAGILNSTEGPASIWAKSVGFLVPVYLLIEIMLPYQKRWAMTWKRAGTMSSRSARSSPIFTMSVQPQGQIC